MSIENKTSRPTRKAKLAFILSFTMLWIATCWLMTIYEDWLIESLRREDIKDGLAIVIASTALMCVAGILMVNLFGVTMTLILPRYRLVEWQQKLVRYPHTLFVLGKVVDYRLKPRFWTP